MRKTLIVIGLVFAGLTGRASAQCENPPMTFHNQFIDVSDLGKYWVSGVEFTAYDVRGNVIAHAPRKAVSRAIRPAWFPLHVYGDNPQTAKIDGPRLYEEFFVHSNMIRNCGRVRTQRPLLFALEYMQGDMLAGFIHPGDLNGDLRIDMADHRAIQAALVAESQDCQFDVNADGVVDANDMGLIDRIALHGDVRSTLGQWGYACE